MRGLHINPMSTEADISSTIVWFRRDLRLRDNPALHWACSQKHPVICIYIHDTGEPEWSNGGASSWWLHHSLTSLTADLKKAGSRLRLFSGDTESVLDQIIDSTKATALVWNRRYEPTAIALDTKLKTKFTDQGIEVVSRPGNLTHEPWQVTRDKEQPYRVFTAYWRASLKKDSLPLTPTVRSIESYPGKISGEKSLSTFELLPSENKVEKWDTQFASHWTPGESGAAKNLNSLLGNRIEGYQLSRDIPSEPGTSQLSPHLAFGEITPRQIQATVAKKLSNNTLSSDDNVESFLREISWREFAYHLLFHFPHMVDEPLDVRFKKFPWKKINQGKLTRWQQGQTGIPLVDAGMRQLWQTGWMHNRVRMVVASLLIKNMGYHWLEGARWFWDTLVDADLASNSMGWQWVAGSGADAAPYFRVFNPVRQGERFDPEGKYVRQWVPEIASLSNKHIHSPWTASSAELAQAAIILGETYPKPIVDLKTTRLEALERFSKIKTTIAK